MRFAAECAGDRPRLLWLSALATGMAVATNGRPWRCVPAAGRFLAGTTKPLRMLPVFCLLAVVPCCPGCKNWLLMDIRFIRCQRLFHIPLRRRQAAVFAQKTMPFRGKAGGNWAH